MSETETALCAECQVPIEAPKMVHFSPLLHFLPVPLCKDCQLKAKTEHFNIRHRKDCPYKVPHWRPKA